ncbi:hypothetical protein D3C80_763000 [compost metagenome]
MAAANRGRSLSPPTSLKYTSSFKQPVRWLRSFTPVTALSMTLEFTHLRPSCRLNDCVDQRNYCDLHPISGTFPFSIFRIKRRLASRSLPSTSVMRLHDEQSKTNRYRPVDRAGWGTREHRHRQPLHHPPALCVERPGQSRSESHRKSVDGQRLLHQCRAVPGGDWHRSGRLLPGATGNNRPLFG